MLVRRGYTAPQWPFHIAMVKWLSCEGILVTCIRVAASRHSPMLCERHALVLQHRAHGLQLLEARWFPEIYHEQARIRRLHRKSVALKRRTPL